MFVCMYVCFIFEPAKDTEKNTLMGNRLAPVSRFGDMVAMVYTKMLCMLCMYVCMYVCTHVCMYVCM